MSNDAERETQAASGEARRLMWLCGALLAVVALWTTREVLGFEFVAHDDDINIYFNPHLGPPGEQSLAWMFTDVVYMRRYVPLGWLTLSCIYEFSGLSPVGYHAADIAFHIVNSLLVYALLLLLLRRFTSAAATRWGVAAAAIGAGMWSLHPLRAEVVGWSSAPLYGASGFWALTSAVAYLRAQLLEPPSRARLRWLGVSWLAYAASILTYPMSIALPIGFVAIDWALCRRQWSWPQVRRLALEKIGFLLPGIAVLAVTVFARYETSSFWPRPPSWDEFTLVQRGAQATAVWACYLWRTIWPAELTPAPTWLFDVDPLKPTFVFSAVCVVGLTVALIAKRSWRPALPLWAAYLGILFPLLGLTEHPHFASDRYSYLAAVILSAAAMFGIVWVRDIGRGAVVVMALGVLAGWSWAQRDQLRIWQDMDSLLTNMLLARPEKEPGEIDYVASNYRKWAMFHAQRGRLERANQIFALAERAAPNHRHVVALQQELAEVNAGGRPPEPAAALLHAKLAVDFSRAGRVREAHEHFRAARKLAPASATLAFNWAVFSALNHEPGLALQLYYRSVVSASRAEINPTARARLLASIADAFAAGGKLRLAVRAVETAIAVSSFENADNSGAAGALRAQRERYRAAMNPAPNRNP